MKWTNSVRQRDIQTAVLSGLLMVCWWSVAAVRGDLELHRAGGLVCWLGGGVSWELRTIWCLHVSAVTPSAEGLTRSLPAVSHTRTIISIFLYISSGFFFFFYINLSLLWISIWFINNQWLAYIHSLWLQ